jgi:SAM-dependent methyltransferase
MSEPVLSVSEFYAGVAAYRAVLDPAWRDDLWATQFAEEQSRLTSIIGPGEGRRILDCACGDGGQSIPLAALGWQVTATDVTESSLQALRRRADGYGVSVDVRSCDMRDLGPHLGMPFDWAICCGALDNLVDEDGIERALAGIYAALASGGRCFLRLRDLQHIRAGRVRYDVKEERILPDGSGRVIRLEDWEEESPTRMICAWIFLHEDDRKVDYRWETRIFRHRRRVVTLPEVEILLREAGFGSVDVLPRPSPWRSIEVIAQKPGGNPDILR